MTAQPEWFRLFLARAPVRVICPDCFGQNPACRHCVGGYVTRHPYAEGSGEQGDDFKDLQPPQLRNPSPRTDEGRASRVVPSGGDSGHYYPPESNAPGLCSLAFVGGDR